MAVMHHMHRREEYAKNTEILSSLRMCAAP